MAQNENALSLTSQELSAAYRRAAFLYPVIRDIEKRGVLVTDSMTLHQTLYLMQTAARIPLQLSFTLYEKSVHSFRFEEELYGLIGRAYSKVYQSGDLVFKTGPILSVQKIEDRYQKEVAKYKYRLTQFVEILSYLSPLSLDLVSLALFLQMQKSDLPLTVRLRKYRGLTDSDVLKATITLISLFEFQ